MVRLIDADALDRAMYHKSFEVDDGRNVWNSGLWIRYKIYEEASREAPTIESVPVKWLYEQSDNPCRSDCFRNACDLVAMTWLEERKEEWQ